MMLSQGQFAAFLNADANDRAELLEELTGTEIYGKISERVYEKHKESKAHLEALGPVSRLTHCSVLKKPPSCKRKPYSCSSKAVRWNSRLNSFSKHCTGSNSSPMQRRK
ncbi:hypothetical protein [Aliamphritea spongicola]|nr:hypothetical protein [Aliamphritea spongicola]